MKWKEGRKEGGEDGKKEGRKEGEKQILQILHSFTLWVDMRAAQILSDNTHI